MRVGGWVFVHSGGSYFPSKEIGYISNVANFTYDGIQYEVTKIGDVTENGFVMKSKVVTYYGKESLEPAEDYLNMFQDFSALLELAISTKDKTWFCEIINIQNSQKDTGLLFGQREKPLQTAVFSKAPLIELALLTKDKAWFSELMQEN